MKTYASTAALLLGCLIAVGPAGAADQTYTIAEDNEALESFFTLDFPEPLGDTQGDITKTDIVMRFEFADDNARFLDYDQDVESLTLPDGQGGPGIETGAITIRILESKNISFDFDAATRTGTFVTEDLYAVFFEGDLSMFGIESPFIMPAVSTGTVVFEANNLARGTIDMVWEGEGIIGEEPFALPFIYTCVVHTLFVIPRPADLNGDGVVDAEDIEFWASCQSGNGVPYELPVCEISDFDEDGDVDRYDRWFIVQHMTR